MFFLTLWGAGLALFSTHVVTMQPPPEPKPVQAAIVLTGGYGRIEKGLELLDQDHVPLLFITGVHQDVSMKDIQAKRDGAPDCCVELGFRAENTYQNALETKEWLSGNPDIEEVYLITANYHMPRALIEFHNMMPDINFHPVPVDDLLIHENYTLFLKLVFGEYHKTLYTYTRQLINQ